MANLTLAIDDDVLRAARIRALEQGTSVNALVREYLERFADTDAARGAIQAFLAHRAVASSGPGGRSWKREELYDRLERNQSA